MQSHGLAGAFLDVLEMFAYSILVQSTVEMIEPHKSIPILCEFGQPLISGLLIDLILGIGGFA